MNKTGKQCAACRGGTKSMTDKLRVRLGGGVNVS